MIGTRLYIRDANRRIRNATGGIDERARWVGYRVMSETRDSWVLDNGVKVNRKTLELRGAYRPGLDNRAYTEAGMADWLWREEHARNILRLVERADTATLRKIAELLGYA